MVSAALMMCVCAELMCLFMSWTINYQHAWIIISNFKDILTPRDLESLCVAELDNKLRTPKISAAN